MFLPIYFRSCLLQMCFTWERVKDHWSENPKCFDMLYIIYYIGQRIFFTGPNQEVVTRGRRTTANFAD